MLKVFTQMGIYINIIEEIQHVRTFVSSLRYYRKYFVLLILCILCSLLMNSTVTFIELHFTVAD